MSLKHVKYWLASQDIKVKKKYGQNFLVDDNILQKIIQQAQLSPTSQVIEIGPGLGNLTHYLLENAQCVYAYEIDAEMISFLQVRFADVKHLNLYATDFLAADLSALMNLEELSLCANIPYNITTPIIFKLIESKLPLKRITLMVQYELAKRLCAPKDSKEYNALSVILDFLYERKLLMNVSHHCFYPKPKVDSAIIQFVPKEIDATIQQALFFNLVKSAFQQKRKTLYNNIKHLISQQQFNDFIKQEHLALTIRAENLSTEQFKQLYRVLYV